MHLIVCKCTRVCTRIPIGVGICGSGAARESGVRVAAHLPANAAADGRAVAAAAHSFALGLADDRSAHAFAHGGADVGASPNHAAHLRCNAAGTRSW